MTLLELTSVELRQRIESELAKNPALELIEERRCPTCRRRLLGSAPCPTCSRPKDQLSEQPIIFVSPRFDFGPSYRSDSEDESSAYEDRSAATEDLPTFVMRQIAPDLAPEDRQLAAYILYSLDEDGLLRTPFIEIARYHHILPSRVQKVIALIQHAEPVGVGSASPQQALLAQLEVLAESRPVPRLAARAIEAGLDLLSRRAYAELGLLMNISTPHAQEIARFICQNLNPYPARAHWGDVRVPPEPQSRYHDPDIIISRLNDGDHTPLVVEVISPYAGALRVNPLFREVLPDAPTEKAEHWQADLEQANLLVKCLQQRDHTLVRLMQRLVVLQRQYLLYGDAYLVPLTRAQIALELDVHESTISRAVSDKAVQLPNRRIVPLAKLFDRSLNVRTALRDIISKEKKPLSDTQIADQLITLGYPVARRTVAKYRAMEGILPARYRQVHAIVKMNG
jgi:RNA polymerase sigma-54 factor